MKRKFKVLSILLAVLVLTSPVSGEAVRKAIRLDKELVTVKEVPVLLDGKLIYTNPISFIDPKLSYTLVPVRFIVESMGAKVGWNEVDRQVGVILGDKYITMNIDSNIVYINGNKKVLAQGIGPRIIEDRTMVPLRFLSETFGYSVDFDSRFAIPIINTKNVDLGFKDEKNRVVKIWKEGYKNRNAIVIHNTGRPELKVSSLSNPNRLVIDIMNSKISKTYGEYRLSLTGIEKLRVSQFDGRKIYKTDQDIVRVVVDMKKGYRPETIQVFKDGNKIILQNVN